MGHTRIFPQRVGIKRGYLWRCPGLRATRPNELAQTGSIGGSCPGPVLSLRGGKVRRHVGVKACRGEGMSG